MVVEWEDGFEIAVSIDSGKAVISGNKEGLLSLAKQLAALAEDSPGSHIHYDEDKSLDTGSDELIVEKTA